MPEPKSYADGISVYCAHDEIIDIIKVIPNRSNPNKHPDYQIDLLARIIKAQGWRVPITISNLSGFIVRGHGRLLAAQKLGVKEVPVDHQDYATEAEEYADLLADNRLAELAEPDLVGVKDILELIDGEIDLDLTGYNLDEILKECGAELDAPDDPGAQIDKAEELQHEWKTEYGQVWEIPSNTSKGIHKLVCGDCTNEESRRLLGSQNADMVFTDPPYNVDYVGKTKDALKIKNDAMLDADFRDFLKSAFSGMAECTKEGSSIYVCHADLKGYEFRGAFVDAGWLLKQCIVWVKQHFVMGRQDYQWKHEPILYGWKDGHAHQFYGGRSQTTVWEINRPMKSPDHPTTKPVELVEVAIKNSSKSGDIVLDPFLGSGTTMIAAERSGRICFGMEIDPKYCAVILQRCLDMGLEPKLLS
jgi:DNA modification methylase